MVEVSYSLHALVAKVKEVFDVFGGFLYVKATIWVKMQHF